MIEKSLMYCCLVGVILLPILALKVLRSIARIEERDNPFYRDEWRGTKT